MNSLNIKSALNALSGLQKATKRQLEVPQITTLLGIAVIDQPEIQDLAVLSDVSTAAAWRQVKKLAEWGLAEIYYNPQKPRSRCSRLTQRGQIIVSQFINDLTLVGKNDRERIDRERILVAIRQNMMIADMVSELGMSIAKANGNDQLLKEIKILGLKFHAITKEAIDELKE